VSTYNGWKNYETWAVNLELSNEENSYSYWVSVAADQMRRARMFPSDTFTVSQDARYELARILKDEVVDAAPEMDGIYGTLLNAALDEVEWSEIANAWLESVPDSGYESE